MYISRMLKLPQTKAAAYGCLPETAPTYVMLTQVLEVRSLLDQAINLHLKI